MLSGGLPHDSWSRLGRFCTEGVGSCASTEAGRGTCGGAEGGELEW
jgi:hypothetical protein